MTPDDVLASLRAAVPEAFTVQVRCEPAWLEGHPGGFAALSFATDNVIYVCPARIVDLMAQLGPEQCEHYLLAITDFVLATGADRYADLDTPTVLKRFLEASPEGSFFLALMAQRCGLDLTTFVGLDQHL